MDELVARTLIDKMREYHFHTGRLVDVVSDGNLPNVDPKFDTVVIFQDQLREFRDKYEMLAWFVSIILEKSDPCGFDILEYMQNKVKEYERIRRTA